MCLCAVDGDMQELRAQLGLIKLERREVLCSLLVCLCVCKGVFVGAGCEDRMTVREVDLAGMGLL